jgi:hypothetical protein
MHLPVSIRTHWPTGSKSGKISTEILQSRTHTRNLRPVSLLLWGSLVLILISLTLIVVTMDSLKKQLDNDEAYNVRLGYTPPHSVTAGNFIWNAIQIEEEQ